MVLSCAVVLFVTFESVYYMVKCGHAIGSYCTVLCGVVLKMLFKMVLTFELLDH